MLSTRKQSGPPVRLGTNEDKDVLIGCLCLFCFCGWEIRSGLELRKWKGLTGNEYCDHRAVWHKCVQRLRYAGAPAQKGVCRSDQCDGEWRQHQHEHRRCGGQRHEELGAGERGYPLYSLVPAPYRHHCGEARLLPHRPGGGQDPAPAVGQAADPGGAGRLLLPLRGPAVHPLRPGLHRLGHDIPRLCEGDVLRHHPVHPHHLCLLHRRGTGQKDSPAALHGGHQHPGPAHPAAVRKHRGPR